MQSRDKFQSALRGSRDWVGKHKTAILISLVPVLATFLIEGVRDFLARNISSAISLLPKFLRLLRIEVVTEIWIVLTWLSFIILAFGLWYKRNKNEVVRLENKIKFMEGNYVKSPMLMVTEARVRKHFDEMRNPPNLMS